MIKIKYQDLILVKSIISSANTLILLYTNFINIKLGHIDFCKPNSILVALNKNNKT